MRWFFGFFLVSGFCALVYEIVWLRLAMAAFGVTTPLVSLVLAVFMGGLGLGCWVAGRAAPAFGRSPVAPLQVYALTELLISVSALVVPLQLSWGHGLLLGLGAEETVSAAAHYGFSALWISLTLLPWSALMGATLPVAMAAIERGFGGSQRSFSYLYLANVLGAVAGTLVPAFLLIELLGFQGTLWLAAGLNASLATAAFLLSRSPALDGARPAGPRTETRHSDPSGEAPRSVLWLLLATGLVSLAMEVVWIRQFTPYLGTVVYAFATILAAYLFATWAGSRVYRWWIRRGAPESSAPLWISLAGLGLLPLVTADPRLPFPNGVHLPSFVRVVGGVGLLSAAVGFLTPMLVDRWSRGDPERAGNAYAINVLGSVLGPLLAGFVLLPSLSERDAILVLTIPLLALAAIALGRPHLLGLVPHPWSRPAFAGVLLSCVLVPVVTRDYEGLFADGEVRRDATAVVVATGAGMDKQLLINGRGMTALDPATKMMTHLPLAFLPRQPRNGIVVAFGMGTSFRSLHSWGVEATAVELVPSVVDLFGYYHDDGPKLLESPMARVVVDDGRRFLERSVDTYDVVIVDPPPPVEAAGTSLLYSKEFYGIVRRRLRPGGVLQQWLFDPGDDAEVRASVTRALAESFDHVRVFRSFEGNGLHFLASDRHLEEGSAAALAARLPTAAARDLVEWGPGRGAEDQFRAVLSAEVTVRELLGGAPHMRALRDDWAVNEYYWLRHRLRDLGLR